MGGREGHKKPGLHAPRIKPEFRRKEGKAEAGEGEGVFDYRKAAREQCVVTWDTTESAGDASRASLMLSSKLACLASSTPSAVRTMRLNTRMPAAVAVSDRAFI